MAKYKLYIGYVTNGNIHEIDAKDISEALARGKAMASHGEEVIEIFEVIDEHRSRRVYTVEDYDDCVKDAFGRV